MHEYRVHTLVDITDNGNLKQAFPFKTPGGEVIHDKASLAMARNQNSNFTTMIQLLQMRANITWEHPPMRVNDTLGNMGFGSFYEGKHTSWHFQFFAEQSGLYGDDTGSHCEPCWRLPPGARCKFLQGDRHVPTEHVRHGKPQDFKHILFLRRHIK